MSDNERGDDALRDFFKSLSRAQRRTEPPFEPIPTCTECHGVGWAQKEVECGGERWMQLRMCACRFPRAH